jgi:hypothetical protein
VADFTLRTAIGPAGTFNVTAPGGETMGDFLAACRAAASSDARFEWVTDENWLLAQGVAQWTELPLWRTYAGAWAVDSSRARAVGLQTRSIRATVTDTWEWLRSGGAAVVHDRAGEQGIAPHKEAAILRTWDAREADRCGAQ